MTGLYTSRAITRSVRRASIVILPSFLPSYLLPSQPHISLDAECHIQDPCSSAKCQHVYAYVLILLVDEILALEE